jgi:amidase
MVSGWLLFEALVAVVPLTNVYAQYSAPAKLPLLLDATAEELTAGLESGAFTSANLVQVQNLNPRQSGKDAQTKEFLY